ncbi:hypothetical protein [Pseudoalteromonas denitrificans]|jgi:hypothetical protein|uniref:Uncharacterized protein n=1 Tax=Pseudoalteromonas denitrificans DSM 6059 TaxID=1123010 RepID=A0A1I1IWF5_9GAMM|nr:hypothetical protein [Pseudoalteromonas denitrificans]SFC38658.1 hypothetical protein SAMN02745724_01576 [Pseudoalteromonas denitrificans DSM 6059]
MRVNVNNDRIISNPQAKKADIKLGLPNEGATSKVSISHSARQVENLYNQISNSFNDRSNRPLNSLSVEKHTEILNKIVQDTAQGSGVKYSEKQISRVVSDLKKDLNIESSFDKSGDISSRSLFSFLSSSDRKEIDKAYQYAIDNGTSLEDVGLASWSLGHQRKEEAMRANGTGITMHIQDPNNIPFESPIDEDETSELMNFILKRLDESKFNVFDSNSFVDKTSFLPIAIQSYVDSNPIKDETEVRLKNTHNTEVVKRDPLSKYNNIESNPVLYTNLFLDASTQRHLYRNESDFQKYVNTQGYPENQTSV